MELSGTGKIEITILRRVNSETNDYWDGNWLEVEIRIEVFGIKTIYRANFRVEDLQRFYEDLTLLNEKNSKKAEFTTMEEGLYLHINVELNGIVNCIGRADTGSGNRMDFNVQSDLAILDVFIRELKTTLESYPLVGSIE
ncbi:MAG: WapI family immunity protein [Sphingobacterium sp.]